jgi:hypothetical protein
MRPQKENVMKKLTALLFFLSSCQHPSPEAKPTPLSPTTIESKAGGIVEAPKVASKERNEDFVKDLQKIAAEYQSYGRADDFFRWAPTLCMMPSAEKPSANFSESADEKTHGKKLYTLFPGLMGQAQQGIAQPTDVKSLGKTPMGKGQEIYLSVPNGGTVPEGFAIVKESWAPEEINDSAKIAKLKKSRSNYELWPYAEKAGKFYQTKEKVGLYVMYKTKAGTPDTDEGWVYGTLTADGQTVTSVGMIKTCMGCHTRAPYGRLFADKKSNGQ